MSAPSASPCTVLLLSLVEYYISGSYCGVGALTAYRPVAAIVLTSSF